tara:strand:- start:529 stop:4167 length:3639 start_codon:yes stop_codon:yes gene_type:complete
MAGKKVDGGTVTIKVTDGDSLKDIQKKVKKARGEFDGLSKSTQAADRAGKGLSRQSSNQTKNFSKMQQGISGGIVPAYATLAANVFALSAAFQFLQTSMNTKNMIEGQKAFGSITGVAYGTITDSIRKATQGQLAFKEAAEAAAIGTAAGLNRDQLERLGQAATNVSLALGRDLADSFNRLVRGVTKAEPELLDELGIVLRLEPALKAYGIAIGKSVQDLNQFEKSQAIANEVLEQAETKFGAIQEVMEPGAFALGQFTSSFNDLLDILKEGLGGMAQTVLPFFTENVAALASALALVAVPILKIMLPNFELMAQSATKNVNKTKASLDILQDEYAQTALASKALKEGGADKIGAEGASYTKGKLGKIGITGKAKDGSGNLSQGQVAAYRRTWKAKQGIWKKMTKQEQIDFKLSLDKMDLAHKASAGKQKITTKKSELIKRQLYKGTGIVYQQVQLKMVQASKVAARGMNMALNAMGIIGIIAMVGSLASAFINMFKTTDKLAEERKAAMEEQGSVNTTISAELNRMIDLRTKEVEVLREVEEGEKRVSKLVKIRVMRYNTDMNMQTARALSSASLSAQSGKYSAAFDADAETVDKMGTKTMGNPLSGFYDKKVKVGETTKFEGAQGETQKGLASSLSGMSELMSKDFMFNDGGLYGEENMVSAKEKLQEFSDVVRGGDTLDEKQVNDLQKIEAEYGSLSSRVTLATEVQKTYDKNLSKMGGKGLYGSAMRNSIEEMKLGLKAQIEMASLAQKDGELDKTKLADLKAQELQVQAFSDALDAVLVKEKAIADAKHVQGMAMEAAKLTRDFESNQSELTLKNEAKKIKLLEAQKAAQIALVAQQAITEPTSNDAADAKENVRLADEKVLLVTEELRVQTLLTLELQRQNRIKKTGEEIALTKKLADATKKLGDAKFYAANPLFGGMSKGTKGAIDRKRDPNLADRTYKQGMNKLDNDYARDSSAIGMTPQIAATLTAQLAIDKEHLLHVKTQAEKSEAERALNNALGAAGGSLESGMTTGLMAVAKGEKKAKDAALDVASGVAEAIMKSLIESFVSNIMTTFVTETAKTVVVASAEVAAMELLNGNILLNTIAIEANTVAQAIPMANGGIIGLANGGITNVKGYRQGGVATEPTYLVGEGKHNEAVVPLPNGRSIPIDGDFGNNNTSIINVTVNSDGSSSMDTNKASEFGKGIQAAVQQEIAKQQRFGGLLSST